MSKFQVDYSNLGDKLTKKAYKLSDVKDKIDKYAFDIVRFRDNDKSAELWQIQSADDGDYIVSMYQEEEDIAKTSDWQVIVIKTAGDVQISYKGDPLVRLGSSKLGIPRSELSQLESYLPAKLAANKKLVKALLKELSETAKNEVYIKYPELV